MNNGFDVLIVGGGLAGGSLALALKASGLRIAVIEAVDEEQRLISTAGDRALALALGSTQILDQIGVWSLAKKHATPIKRIHVSDRGHFGKVRMKAEPDQAGALGYVATARVLEEAVYKLLNESSIELISPASVIGVSADHDAVHVCLKKACEIINLSAKLLVAADGGNSTVRKLLEIGQSMRDYGQTAVVTEVETEKLNQFVAFERFTDSGPLAFLPMGERRSSVVWTQKPEDAHELLSMSDAEFISRLQASFGFWLGKIRSVSSRQGFPLKLIRSEKMVDNRVVLIGNAAHQLHPVAGQGFNLGLRDVALLSEQILAQIDFKQDIGDAAFLNRFASARQADLNNVIQFTDSMVRIFSNDFWPVAFARNAGLLALDHCGFAKRLLARYAMGLGHRIPRFSF